MVLSNGTIATVAGNGSASFSGDGGAARSAALNSPRAVAISLLGDLYVADSSNNRIRHLSPVLGRTFDNSGNGTLKGSYFAREILIAGQNADGTIVHRPEARWEPWSSTATATTRSPGRE